MSILYKYAAIAAVVSALFFSVWSWHKAEVHSAVTDARAAVEQSHRVAMDEQRKRLVARSDASEAALKAKIATNQTRKSNEVKSIRDRTAVVSNSVQSRTSRTADSGSNSASNTEDGKATQGTNGAGLFREDSTFLIGEASRAEVIKKELEYCYEQYDSVYDMLSKYAGFK